MTFFLQHPLATLTVFWIVIGLVWRRSAPASRDLTAMWRAGLLVATALYAGIAVWYVTQPAFMDAAEASIPAVAAMWLRGGSLYPSRDAAEVYAHVYGPAFFLIHAAGLQLLGLNTVVSKAIGAAATLLALTIGHATFTKRFGVMAASAGTTLTILTFTTFGHVAYWVRPEPILILCVTVATCAAATLSVTPAAILAGAAAGVAVNMKLTGVAYVFPAIVILAARHGWRAAAGAALTASALGAAPFVLYGISWTNYIDLHEMAASNGLLASNLKRNVEWSVVLLLPLLLQWRRGSGNEIVILSLVASMAAIDVVAAKPGSGPYHLLPFVPLIAYATMGTVATGRSNAPLIAGLAMTLVVMGVPKQLQLVQTVAARDLRGPLLEVDRFAASHPGETFAVGYAGSSFLAQARAAAVFHAGDFLLDAPAVQERRLSGHDLPSATYEALRSCRIIYWLMPRDGPPFDVVSAYQPIGPRDVFPPAFREAFAGNHAQVETLVHFDVWRCRARSTGAEAPR